VSRAEIQGLCRRTFDKGIGVMQGNATSLSGFGVQGLGQAPEGSKGVHRVLTMDQVGLILRVDLQDV